MNENLLILDRNALIEVLTEVLEKNITPEYVLERVVSKTSLFSEFSMYFKFLELHLQERLYSGSKVDDREFKFVLLRNENSDYSIWKVSKGNRECFVKISGIMDSYDGFMGANLTEVHPVTKTTIVYE